MQTEEIRKYQLSQLALMDYVDGICRANGIRYYLIAGTLLGSVRHGGFIPWDADIDIARPRKDYEVFRRYCAEHPDDRFFYQHYSTEPNHLSPHALLRIKGTHVIHNNRLSRYRSKYDGIYMDIFPLDTPPCDLALQEKQAKKIANIRRIIEVKAGYLYPGKTSTLKRIIKRCVQIALSPISFRRLHAMADKEMQKYSMENSGYLVSMASRYAYRKQCMPCEIYGEPRDVLFENKTYLAPADTEGYLKRLYGDYMKLPPEDKRFSELDQIDRIEYEK